MTKGKLKQRKIATTETETGINYIRITLVIIVILAVFYLITYFVTTGSKETEKEPTIQYTEIIAGNILNVKDKEYYVLATMADDQYADLYAAYLSSYSSTEEALPYYKVDMTKGFNQSYISDSPNMNPVNASELKLSATTLLKINEGKIINYYNTNETIIQALKDIVK